MAEIKYKEDIIKLIRIYFSDAKIYLYGSFARGDQKADSDIDIAIDVGRKISWDELQKPWILIDALPMARTVELVDFHSVPKVMQDNIMREGIEWKV